MPETRELSWDDIDTSCELLATRIARLAHDTGKSIGLLLVSRGGLVIGRLIDGYLRRCNVNAVVGVIGSVGYTDDHEQRDEQTITEPFWIGEEPEVVIVVDDIADTGRTLTMIRDALKPTNVLTATLFYKPTSTIQPNFYSHMVHENLWLTFPFETEDRT